MLMNVGGGGGGAAPAAAPASAPAAGGDAAAAPAKAEEKEEGTFSSLYRFIGSERITDILRSQGGVGRGHGLRSLRLSVSLTTAQQWQRQWQSIDGAQNSACGYSLDGYASKMQMQAQLMPPPLPTFVDSHDLVLRTAVSTC